MIGTGILSIVDDMEEKKHGLDILMKQISGNKEWTYSEEMINAVAVFKLDVEKMSCKAK